MSVGEFSNSSTFFIISAVRLKGMFAQILYSPLFGNLYLRKSCSIICIFESSEKVSFNEADNLLSYSIAIIRLHFLDNSSVPSEALHAVFFHSSSNLLNSSVVFFHSVEVDNSCALATMSVLACLLAACLTVKSA